MSSKKKWISIASIIAVIIALALVLNWLLNTRGTTDIIIGENIEHIEVTSSAFEEDGTIPDVYTGRSLDISPDLELEGLSDKAVSIAIVMDDLDVPWSSNYTHWVIWNIPASSSIPQAIPPGEVVPSLGGAVQGKAYGSHQYRGPNPPFGAHRYQFHIFVLDNMLELSSSATKAELVSAIDGHIIQYGAITGWYPKA